MLNEKYLTNKDVDLLIEEGWLTDKQQQAFVVFNNTLKSRQELEAFCNDQYLLDTIFDERIDTNDVEYRVWCLSRGLYKEGQSEVFKDVLEAIKRQKELAKQLPAFKIEIEVVYNKT